MSRVRPRPTLLTSYDRHEVQRRCNGSLCFGSREQLVGTSHASTTPDAVTSAQRLSLRLRDAGKPAVSYRLRCRSTFPLSAETICTVAIWSTGIEVLAPGVALAPLTALQVASWSWLPSRATTTLGSLSPGSFPPGAASFGPAW